MDAGLVETHMSVLFFLGDRAYKLKKPVRFPFADLRSRAVREAMCHREVDLNRRLAPDIYEGVADVTAPDGSVCDHLVVMRRLADDRRLSHLVAERDSRLPGAIDEIAEVLARFHEGAARSPSISAAGRRDAVARRWQRNADQIQSMVGHPFDPDLVARADALAGRFLAGRSELFADRIEGDHICDGHGDLLADDVFVLDDGPRLLDCLEFDDELRHVDVADDLAVLMMELERLGAPDLATRLVQAYEREVSTTVPTGLLHFYVAYRAQVRALVAALRAAQSEREVDRRNHESGAALLMDLCVGHLARASVRLVLVGGLPGTGKTTVATELGRRTGWPVLRSDVVRKQLTGRRVVASAAAPYGQGIYTPEMTEATYDALLGLAGDRLGLGLSVIMDASFVAKTDRDRARLVARQHHADLIELRCVADDADAAHRIEARQASGGDASDADATIAARLAEVAEPWPESLEIDNRRSSEQAVAQAVAALGPT